jgi:hypothetical protein
MPGWGDILTEIQQSVQQNGGMPDFDGVRRKYLHQLHALTGRSTVSYTTDFLGVGAGQQTMITLGDMQGLMEVFRDLPGPNLDLILHSPGGQAEATDRIVRYMRSKFDHVRVFVPLAAMSAATMWAMAADEIVMGKHSQLGPIDPQINLPSGVTVPARALLDQFEEASEKLAAEPEKIAAWLPTLQQYPPGLLNVCESAAELARVLVSEWLQTYMLASVSNKADKAASIADWLNDDKAHLSHSRAVTRDQLTDHGVTVIKLEEQPALQDAVLSVHHAAMHTLNSTAAVKIIENHLDRAFVQQVMPFQMPQPGAVPMQVPPASPQQITPPDDA